MITKKPNIICILMLLTLLATPCEAQKQVIKRHVSTQKTDKKPVVNNRVRNDKAVTFHPQRITEAECNQIINRIIDNMVRVEGGTFIMGDDNPTYSNNAEKPAHKVTLSSFYIGKYEITKLEWKAVMAGGGMTTEIDDLPMERISKDDVMEFIRALNSITGRNFRLPTEAEWEFAARGGNMSHGYRYSGSNNPKEVSWDARGMTYKDDFGYTHPVGKKKPNELGLYDMSGNVFEWVSDWYGPYSAEPQTNPTGPASPDAENRAVTRGGCWSWRFGEWEIDASTVTYRYPKSSSDSGNDTGFRLAMSAD